MGLVSAIIFLVPYFGAHAVYLGGFEELYVSFSYIIMN